MNIAIGADHRGYEHKKQIIDQLTSEERSFMDVGAHTADRSDYPEFAIAVAQAVQQRKANGGILICGTGVGMSIVANRYAGIYAGLVWTVGVVREAKEDDNINVIVIPADFVSSQTTIDIVQMWLATSFKGGHYQNRINAIDAIGGVRLL